MAIQGHEQVIAALKAQGQRIGSKAELVVGYSALYAVYVHENLQAQHPNGQAKFLEEPARILAPAMQKIVRIAIGNVMRQSFRSALLQAGTYLLTESQKLVPVDTGALKASGFVRIDG